MRLYFLLLVGLGCSINLISPIVGLAEESATTRQADVSDDEKAIREAGAAYRRRVRQGRLRSRRRLLGRHADLVDQAGHAFKVQARVGTRRKRRKKGAIPAAASRK